MKRQVMVCLPAVLMRGRCSLLMERVKSNTLWWMLRGHTPWMTSKWLKIILSSHQCHYFNCSGRKTMLATGNKRMHVDPNTADNASPRRKLRSKPTSLQGSRTPQCHHISEQFQPLLHIPCPASLLLLGLQTP